MRIVKYGIIKPEVATCKKCEAVFEFVKRDTSVVGGKPIVRCPVCGQAKVLEDNK